MNFLLRVLWPGLICCLFLAPANFVLCAETLHVFVTVPPLKYPATKIGGARVRVSSLVPPGVDAHTFEPRPALMTELARADLYFFLGGLSAFEDARLPAILALHPNLLPVDISRGITRLSEKHADEDKDAAHSHAQGDPHIWTSPRLAAEQAKIMHAAFVEHDPDHTTEYNANLAAFLKETAELDEFFRRLFAGREGSRFLVFHPAWAYFAADYGLVQLAAEVDGKEPKATDTARLITLIREERIPVLFVSPHVSPRSAKILAEESGIKLVPADPLAENWADNLRAVGQAFADALR